MKISFAKSLLIVIACGFMVVRGLAELGKNHREI
jgi:hypothetical protein